MKTIFAPKAVIEKWLAALRSGGYQQGFGTLCDGWGRYCCLGVLEHCLTGKTEVSAAPSMGWLEENGIRFMAFPYPGAGELSNAISPHLPALKSSAWEANDIGRHSFLEIADAIEECAEYTDNEQA